ncbi:MAG TPA: SPOR domain-containing protein [Pseudolabrys sp.]|nr:SPOR domain-containing protein [Pseudolabrys sp.]
MTQKTFNMRALWRLMAWGGSAALAVSGVVLLGGTESGASRLQEALSSLQSPGQAKAVVAVAPAAVRRNVENETRRLAETVRQLTADRDRLAARVASLESNVADMTGSIKDMSSTIKKDERATVTPAAPVAPAPVISAPAAVPPAAAASTETLPRIPPSAPNKPEPAETPKTTASIAPTPEAAPPPAAAEQPPLPQPKPKPAIGVDLGSAASMEGLQSLWAMLKANHGPLFTGLQPFVHTQTTRSGKQELRLVLGPMPNASTAARYCTMLAAARMTCKPVTYEGARLAQQ